MDQFFNLRYITILWIAILFKIVWDTSPWNFIPPTDAHIISNAKPYKPTFLGSEDRRC